mmetsp:Transcript_11467/g.18462  ORF Transcript_11467/g.18462 Transcript_11467/m.18462 type:complete len:599 (-) Transcript_11467:211-2007(-)
MAQANTNNTNNDDDQGYPVQIYIYDLSQGMASMYSQALIGKQVDGIWHTSIIVYEKEYFYGGGVQSDNPGQTPYGSPVRKIDMGFTQIPQSVFHEFLNEVAPRFSPSKYDLFKHNCNTFANEAMQFLNGQNIPEYITGLPEDFLNSPAGQMLKPMIDNMQQQAVASYGDWGGMGIAAKPHLPPLNPKYNQGVDLSADDKSNNKAQDKEQAMTFGGQQIASNKQMTIESNNNNSNNNDDTVQSNEISTTEQKENEIAIGAKKTGEDSLVNLLDKYYENHKHKSMDLKVLKNELLPKVTNDTKNAQLYVSMVTRNTEMINARQQERLTEFVKFLDRKRAAEKKGMNIILKLSDDAFEILDELLLMSEADQLFPIVSLLRLLLVYPDISQRYTGDFMIINQILYKIGIQFEEQEDVEMAPSNEEKQVNDEETGLNLMDLHLLQFTAISAVSHLYSGQGDMVNVEENFINLALNALKVQNSNVRLAASRLLFNIVYEIKRQYIFMSNDTSDVTKDYNKEIEELLQKLKRVINGVSSYYKKETHLPTMYRLLCIFGLVCYCDDNQKLVKQIDLSVDAIKQLEVQQVDNEEMKKLQNDLITVMA